MKNIHLVIGHIGINILHYEIMRRGLYWYNIIADIINFIKKCPICSASKLNIAIKLNNMLIIAY